MRKTFMLAALVFTSGAFAHYNQQGYSQQGRNNQNYNQGNTQNQPYYQSQGNTYYQTQPGYQTQDGYYQTQPQGQQYNSNNQGYISQADTAPAVTSTPNGQSVNVIPQQDAASTDQDKQINAKIRDKLKNLDIKGYETIVIRTQNGIVMISGSVDKVDDMVKIRDHVKDIEGVKAVNNQVTAKTK